MTDKNNKDKKRNISILGSTGSIGINALEVARHFGLGIKAMSAGSNLELFYEQIMEFKPDLVSLNNPLAASQLKDRLKDSSYKPEIMTGEEGNLAVAAFEGIDMTLAAIVGVAGLRPVAKALSQGIDIALANKETLVAGGKFIMDLAKESGAEIYPVDSEHSAIWQALPDQYDPLSIRKLYLTASGGPFRGRSKKELENVLPEEALKHPNWEMGKKISIDSATLMNKGLEVIEAHWLFDMPADKIEVVIHPQSVIHSMVEFVDRSILAQLGAADMRLPIQLALLRKKRREGAASSFNPLTSPGLTFEEPDTKTFPCLTLAREALDIGGTMPAVMNSANEKAVDMFLGGLIGFNQIPLLIGKTMEAHLKSGVIKNTDCDIVMELDFWSKEYTEKTGRQIR